MTNEFWVEKKAYKLGEEYLKCIGDTLAHPVLQSMDDYIQRGTTTCKTYCIQVSYILFKIRRNRGWNYRFVVRTELLRNLSLYDRHTHAKEVGEHSHGFAYPRKATNDAMKYFGISGVEGNLILRHMWPLTPAPPKHVEDYVILCAGKFCGLAEMSISMKRWPFCDLILRHLG